MGDCASRTGLSGSAPSREDASRPSASIPIAAILRARHEREFTEAEFWLERATLGAPLKPLGKPCHDCAVVFCLYAEMTDRLAEQPADVQREVSARWWCHNHPSRACRGNLDRLALLAQGGEARRAETALAGSVHEHPVAEGDAPAISSIIKSGQG